MTSTSLRTQTRVILSAAKDLGTKVTRRFIAKPARPTDLQAAVWCGLLLLSSAAPALAVDPAVIEAENARVALIEEISPAVVAIFGSSGDGGGSGVLISADGYALSNFHVTSGSGAFMKCGLNDGRLYDAVIVGVDPTGDVALLKLLGRDDFPYAEWGDSDQLNVGDWVYVIGNPFLLATDFRPTVTYGIVSGVHRYQYPAGTFLEYTDCIQVDASINPGNSGGPLFNSAGQLVGINGRASFEKRGRVNSGAGYAISINQIKHFLDHLRGGRIVDHATLGATVTTARDGAVVVDGILERSDAYRRGLRVDDEIVSFADRPIRSVNQFKNILGIYPDGWELPLVYRRESQKHEIRVQLQPLHSASEMRQGPRMGPPRRKPNEKPPEEERPDKRPQPLGAHSTPASPPAKYSHMYVSRPGFANYYFNDLEQDRVLAGLRRLGDFTLADGAWIFTGVASSDQRAQFTLAEAAAGLELGNVAFFQPLGDNDLLDEPPGTGGLLAALSQFRLLLLRGENAFTEFYYLGSEPLDGTQQQVDVLVTVLAGAESRWYFDRHDGDIVGFDTRLIEDVDACEVRFQQLQDFGGRLLPSRILVRHAGQEFMTFHLQTVELRSSGTPDSLGDEEPE